MAIEIKKLSISAIKPNPNNPRIIKDEQYKKLVQSIKDLPEMLDAREIVVNTDMVILGGNMRFKTLKRYYHKVQLHKIAPKIVSDKYKALAT